MIANRVLAARSTRARGEGDPKDVRQDSRPSIGLAPVSRSERLKGHRDAGDSVSVSDGTLAIVGWHKSVPGTENFLSFLVTEHGQGAVSQVDVKARGRTMEC
jgi:hypothetical protein